MPTDTERLDWLQAQLDQKRYSGQVILRRRGKGGIALHETTARDYHVRSSIRAVIDNAMEIGRIDQAFIVED